MREKIIGYTLQVYGDHEFLKSYFSERGVPKLTRLWDTNESFCIRRILFPKFVGCNMISRRQFSISCESKIDERSFFLEDHSTKGTILRSEILTKKGSKYQLNDGDDIGIIWDRINGSKYHILFGLRFIVEFDFGSSLESEKSQTNLKGKRKLGSEDYSSEDSETFNKKLKLSRSRRNSDHDMYEHYSDNETKLERRRKKGDNKWTPEEEEKLMSIVKNRRNGISWKELAQDFPGRTSEAIRNKYKKISELRGSQSEREMQYASAVSSPDEESSSIIEDGSLEDLNSEDRRGKLWTAEEDAKLKELVLKYRPQEQKDWEVIASQLGRTIKSCKHKYNDNLRGFI